MRLTATVLMVAFSAVNAFGVRHVGFEADAFNRCYPISYARDFVLSPVSFEIDCAVFANCMDTISKAGVAERIGATSGIDRIYVPVVAELDDRTNGVKFVSARGFCVPELDRVAPQFKSALNENYAVMFCSIFSIQGSEAWFRTQMEGKMEDFKLTIDETHDDRYSYYDLTSVNVRWMRPFPAKNTVRGDFTAGDGTKVSATYMRDVRKGSFWVNSSFVLLNLPMSDGCVFYALMPKKGADFSTVRSKFTSMGVENLLVATKSITEKGVFDGMIDVSIPKISIYSHHDISTVLAYFKIPTISLKELPGVRGVKEIVQRVRFELDERGIGKSGKADAPAEHAIALNRQFMYFIYHEPTSTILVAGQYTGLNN